mmetsp:Transcript_2260/g.3049  ORF Transcript_2260/g.3049 Transcript_2260/m.3049 type:complete len:333 (+) Transcript_2260:58-1056(+)
MPLEISKEDQKVLKKNPVLVRDLRWNTLGVANVMVSGFVLGRAPQFFWVLHLLKAILLLPWRWVRFSAQNAELYMLDFCYFAGFYYVSICAFFGVVRVCFGTETFLTPFNDELFRIFFAFASGPLAWSIYIFRNSLVLHDPDYTTSVWIHLSPALTVWCLRWGGGLGLAHTEQYFPDLFRVCPGVPFPTADACMFDVWCAACPAGLYEFILHPLLFYVVMWAVPFYIVVFVLLREYIEREGKDTLFKYLSRGNTLGPLIRAAPSSLQPLVYMLIHGTSVVVFSALGYVFWHSFWAHTIFLVAMIFKAVHNGSHYLFEVFSLRYASSLPSKIH